MRLYNQQCSRFHQFDIHNEGRVAEASLWPVVPKSGSLSLHSNDCHYRDDERSMGWKKHLFLNSFLIPTLLIALLFVCTFLWVFFCLIYFTDIVILYHVFSVLYFDSSILWLLFWFKILGFDFSFTPVRVLSLSLGHSLTPLFLFFLWAWFKKNAQNFCSPHLVAAQPPHWNTPRLTPPFPAWGSQWAIQ